MKCYRVWFQDGSALLVDAESEKEARTKAIATAKFQGAFKQVRKSYTIKEVEWLS